MDFDFSFEQRMLADSVAKVLQEFPAVTDRPPYPYEASEVTARLAGLGLFGEGGGGTPLGRADAVAVAMEAGRTIVAAPLIETLAAALALSGQDAEIAARLAAGEPAGVAVSGRLVMRDGRVSGEAVVPHGASAGLLAVPFDGAAGPGWAVLDAADARLEPVDTMDITAGAARARFEGVAMRRRRNALPGSSMDEALQLLALAEIVGAADACLKRTVAYVGERKQFGKPIGSNQAVKHMAADCALAVETMKAAVEYAGWALDAAQEDAGAAEEGRLALLSAASYVGEHGRRVAERCVQMHGGIAFTWDYGLHVPLRRIAFRTATLAGTRTGREALAAHLLD